MVHGLNYYHGSALANAPSDGVLETLYQHHLSQALAGIGKKKNSKVVQVEFCNLPQNANVSFVPQQQVQQEYRNVYKHEQVEAMQLSPQQQGLNDQAQPMEANNSALAFETFFQDLEQAPTMISMMMGQKQQAIPQPQPMIFHQHHNHAQQMHHDDEECDYEDEDSMGSGSPNSQKISPGSSPQEKSAVDQFLSQALTITSNRRANFACSECRKSHKACSGGRPCERCVKLGLSDSCRDISRKKRCVTKKHWHKFMGSANIKEQIMKVQQDFVTKCSQEQKSMQSSPRGGRRTSISAAGSSC